MNSEAGFCIASGRSVPEDPRGACHWGTSSCHRLHMRTGRSRLRRYDLTGDADRKRYCRIGERSPDVEHCLTTRAFVASLVLRPSCSSSFSFISKLTDVGPVELWATRLRRPSAAANPQGLAGRVPLAVSDPWLEPIVDCGFDACRTSHSVAASERLPP